MKRTYIIGLGGAVICATILSFTVFGSQTNSNMEEVLDEEIIFYSDGIVVDEEYMNELQIGTMELAKFIGEKLQDTDIKVKQIELDLPNLPNRRIHIEELTAKVENSEETVNEIMKSAIAEGIVRDDEPYEIIVKKEN
ncbi:hypothetical protein [Halalkalibacter akibai]|uniref:Uncharacterized protein n=1 Tax=Halalkalibacter akibai (strain ATCC 43226 / DSM 21942 / CIP 109018 / JCM 9157 / 1139) TaxID=1236973 RepID=W4QMF2_HALA3|nr:hypothetical protein [Halalkalibacter akibai]GAE33300.1 hypothetical protein JCM9157_296 [Halalkalibacter akibai JCM 9157]